MDTYFAFVRRACDDAAIVNGLICTQAVMTLAQAVDATAAPVGNLRVAIDALLKIADKAERARPFRCLQCGDYEGRMR